MSPCSTPPCHSVPHLDYGSKCLLCSPRSPSSHEWLVLPARHRGMLPKCISDLLGQICWLAFCPSFRVHPLSPHSPSLLCSQNQQVPAVLSTLHQHPAPCLAECPDLIQCICPVYLPSASSLMPLSLSAPSTTPTSAPSPGSLPFKNRIHSGMNSL